MYISTAITYQTHIEAGQGRGRSFDDDDDCGDGGDDYYHLRKERVSCYDEIIIFLKARSAGMGNWGASPLQGGLGGGERRGHHYHHHYHHHHHHCIYLPLTPPYIFSPQQNESRMGKLMSKNSEGQNLPYIPDNTLAQLTVKELNKKVRQMEIQVMITLVKSHDEQRRRRKSL